LCGRRESFAPFSEVGVAFTVADGEETVSELTETRETIRKRAENLKEIADGDLGPDTFGEDAAEPR
jgi:hypothetical protein